MLLVGARPSMMLSSAKRTFSASFQSSSASEYSFSTVSDAAK